MAKRKIISYHDYCEFLRIARAIGISEETIESLTADLWLKIVE
jgi:hypothetical protein